jgi:hypothetical protein
MFERHSKTCYIEVDVRSIETLEGDKSIVDLTYLKIRKINKTRMIIGNITVNTPIDDSFIMGVLAFVKQGNEYRKMPYRIPPKKMCQFIKDDDYFYEELTQKSSLPMPAPCPFEVEFFDKFLMNKSDFHYP